MQQSSGNSPAATAVLAVLAAGGAVYLQATNQRLILFRLVPLNWMVLAAVAAALGIGTVIQCVARTRSGAPKGSEAQATFNQLLQQAAGRAQNAGTMPAAATINVMDMGRAGEKVSIQVGVNGVSLGALSKGGVLTTQSSYPQNTLTLVDTATCTSADAPFSAAPGATVNLSVIKDGHGRLLIEEV